jgi:hypothetical protein
MGGITNRIVATMVANPVKASETQQWATFVCDAHAEAFGMKHSFTVTKRATTNQVAPRGNIISTFGDPSYVVQNFPPTIHTNVAPPYGRGCGNSEGCAVCSGKHEDAR